MKPSDIRDAFGATPATFRSQVNAMIDRLEDKPMKQRGKITTILAAALIVALLSAAAVAGFQGRLIDMFKDPETETANDAIADGIQTLSETYEGATVRCTVQEALYDAQGGTFALSWALDNLTGEDNLYVVCDSTKFDGERGAWRSMSFVSEFMLPQGATVSTLVGELPENRSNHCELSISVLRAVGPYEIEEDGWIEVEGLDLGAEEDSILYSDALVASGSFEIADRFTLKFDLDDEKLGDTTRHLASPDAYVFDDYEICIPSAEITATAAHIVVEYITDEPVVDGGKGVGPAYEIDFALPDSNSWWSGNAGGTYKDPVQLDDGRWKNVYDYHAIELFTHPDTLVLTLSTFEIEDGSFDIQKPVTHLEDAITLKFE